MPTRFPPLLALALQNSGILGDTAPGLKATLDFVSTLLSLDSALAVFFSVPNPEPLISAPCSFFFFKQIPTPGLAPSRLSPPSSFLLGKMEVLRAGGAWPTALRSTAPACAVQLPDLRTLSLVSSHTCGGGGTPFFVRGAVVALSLGAAEGTLEENGDRRAASMAPDPVSPSWPVFLLSPGLCH